MLTRHGFAAVLFGFSAIVAGAVSPLAPQLAPLAGALRKVDQGIPTEHPPETGTGPQVQPPAAPRPPALLVRREADEPSVPLVVRQARYEVTVTGRSARTRATLVFYNPFQGSLRDAELVFPLPEGALVTGFGLDVRGQIVDGVVVEAQAGRIAFEEEMRTPIDPGLVEWVRGNNFRTRVWPIAPTGTRTVVLEYLSDLVTLEGEGGRESLYELPLRFPSTVNELALRIDVVRPGAAPVVRSAFGTFAFERWDERYVAEQTWRDARPVDDLRIAVPETGQAEPIVETSPRDGTFFVVDDTPAHAPAKASSTNASRRLAVAWDASFSRAAADRERDLRLLGAHLAQVGTARVDVIVFRNVAEPVRRFQVAQGHASALVDYLRDQPCDGGTNLGAVALPDDVDYSLLFSDGLSTLASESATGAPSRPIFVLSGDPAADHARLRAVAARTGGTYFNLSRQTDADVLAHLGEPAYSLLAVESDGKSVADVEPAGAQPVIAGRVRITGRLIAPAATVVLKYGWPGQPAIETRTIALRSTARGKPTGLASRLWAQQRIAALEQDVDAYRDELVTLGRRFSIVTPGTSLIVFENVSQYLEHDVTPPESLPEMRAAFLAQRDAVRARRGAATDKMPTVVAMWEERVAHWRREFSRTPGKPSPVEPARLEADASRGRLVDRLVREAPQAATPPFLPANEERLLRAARQAVDSSASAVAPAAVAGVGPELADAQEQPYRPGPHIVIKAWTPETPYLRVIANGTAPHAYERYLSERERYATSPGFYLDCAEYFMSKGERALAIRVMTNVAELRLEDARLIRVLAHRLQQIGEIDMAVALFEQVLRLRPEEPQSPRDLALALDARANAQPRAGATIPARATGDYRRALALFADVVRKDWDSRFAGIEAIALVEANRVSAILERATGQVEWPLDLRLRKLLDYDLRVVLTWDTDDTDMDLWVVEPAGERCHYAHALTTLGGALSKDFTRGYGPEEYVLRRAADGDYLIKANFYGSRWATLAGPTVLQATVITNFGRPDESRRAITVRLDSPRNVVEVGAVAFHSGTK